MKKLVTWLHVPDMSPPGANPSSGAYFYAQGGVLKVRQANGSVITVAGGPAAPSTLTDAATIATDASLGNHFRVTLGGNRTLGNPTNPTDGQKVVWEIIQPASGGPYTLTLGSNFAFGTDITAITLSTTASKRDYMGAIYNSSLGKWHVVSFVRGY